MNFKNKRIGIIGAGVEGISAAKYLSKRGADITLLDQKIESELDSKSLNQAKDLRAKLKFGKTYLEGLENFDILIRSPFVRPDLPEIEKAKERGVVVTSQTKIFFDICPAVIIGVTGTKGKGTTSTLLNEILKADKRKVFFGGNVGKAPLDFLDNVDQNSLVVLELSSFQLLDLHKSPTVAVVLMVTSEHLDWHTDSDEYIEAKKNITKFQNSKDVAIINKDFPYSLQIGNLSKGKKYYFSTKEKTNGAYLENGNIKMFDDGLIKIGSAKLPGKHNIQNIMAAVLTAKTLGVDVNTIQGVTTEFKGLPHRLEFVGEIDEVPYFDDSASTIPETSIAAVAAFDQPKILILGGSSKNSDFSSLIKRVVTSNTKVVILIGQEAEKIKLLIERSGKFTGQLVLGLNDMTEVVQTARKIASRGDVVILSPGCASFGMFQDYQDRGHQFKKAVQSLISQT